MNEWKESKIKVSSRDSKNSDLSSYEDDDVIVWKGYIFRSKPQTRAQALTEVQRHALSPPFAIHSLLSLYFFGPGHWKRHLGELETTSLSTRALPKKNVSLNHRIKFGWNGEATNANLYFLHLNCTRERAF